MPRALVHLLELVLLIAVSGVFLSIKSSDRFISTSLSKALAVGEEVVKDAKIPSKSAWSKDDLLSSTYTPTIGKKKTNRIQRALLAGGLLDWKTSTVAY